MHSGKKLADMKLTEKAKGLFHLRLSIHVRLPFLLSKYLHELYAVSCPRTCPKPWWRLVGYAPGVQRRHLLQVGHLRTTLVRAVPALVLLFLPRTAFLFFPYTCFHTRKQSHTHDPAFWIWVSKIIFCFKFQYYLWISLKQCRRCTFATVKVSNEFHRFTIWTECNMLLIDSQTELTSLVVRCIPFL